MIPRAENFLARLVAVWPQYGVFAMALAVSVVFLIVDSHLPLGVAGGALYVAVIVLGRWFPNSRQIVLITILSGLLIIVGFFTSPEGGVFWVVITNRSLALFAIIVTAWALIAEKKAQKSRAESEARFSQVLDNAISGVISIDDRGIIQSFNRAAMEIFGYAAQEVIGKNVKMLMPAPYTAHHDAYISNYVRTDKAQIIGIGREVEGLRKDGSIFPMDLAISELSAGEQRLFAGTVTDISDRKEWEAAVLVAKDAAEFANQAKSEFLSSMSHELRTPLNAILGFTQLLNTDKDHPLSAGQIDATEQVLLAGDHLLVLIDQVLDLAAIESGKVPLDSYPQAPTKVISNCTAIASNLAEQKGLEFFDRTTAWSLPEISIDATRFQQVLLNLLSNAVKYNRDNGTVTLSGGEGREGWLRLAVADSGRGIAEEKQGQIFMPFSRLGLENSDITGTGIGLTITKELVESMGGVIGFDSTLNLGSTFWLEFPIINGVLSVKEQHEPASDTADGIVSAGQGNHTVLCVEDNPGSLKLLESIIRRIPDTAMISAHTGELGIDLAEIHHPDVILMDINLPGMNGFEALKRLKESIATQDIPVIALTARASERDKAFGKGKGFEHYLTKPINVEEVTQVIRDAIG